MNPVGKESASNHERHGGTGRSRRSNPAARYHELAELCRVPNWSNESIQALKMAYKTH
jgi:hypothetical protein